MNYQESVEYIQALGHEMLAMRPGLERIERILERLGDPQKTYPAVIVAGTNGKGSVAAMIDAILRAAGIRTGLFTSPHLVRPEERLQVDGSPISEASFAAVATPISDSVEALFKQGRIASRPSFFEFFAAMAFEHFRQQRVDLAILEVGMGGRLDATNAAPAFLTVITPIDFDHEQHLGDTLPAIAAEKAATIKPGCRVVVSPQHAEAMEVIEKHCLALGIEPLYIGQPGGTAAVERRCDRDGHRLVDLSTTEGRIESVLVGLRGPHQVVNANTAVEACLELRRLDFDISELEIREGLASVRWPGRLELLIPEGSSWPSAEQPPARPLFDGLCLAQESARKEVAVSTSLPPIMLDGAHNPSAARALRAALDEIRPPSLTLLFGIMKDKRIDQIAHELFPLADTRILTRIADPRAADGSDLRAIADGYGPWIWADRPVDGLKRAVEATPASGIIVVTGSLYLVGEVKRLLGQEGRGV
ncbi:MAG: bifunctional folylpolyglutamate synthase/dihydrofolate synthase [Acidobacteria bacterium]|nr:bifunctional folylpolyglutamate synthase/dihydrofolate synthase [Acidobacteriota bacterium]